MNRRLALRLGAATALAGLGLARAGATAVPVRGQLRSRTRGAVPGVAAYLVHPVLGRSVPSYTDADGHFGWLAIPVRQEVYYLEMYWGQRLIYRQPVAVRAPLQLAPISL